MANIRRHITLLLVTLVFILSILSLTFQFITIHRLDSVAGNLLLGHEEPLSLASPAVDAHTKPIIAYAITVTGCGGDKRYARDMAMGLITQGAAVLRHSIYLAHKQSEKYDFQMYAFVHPEAKECSEVMSKLGYTVSLRDIPFNKTDIRGDFLREHIDGASCCGAKEFIKLYAYTLLDHPVAVILDLDSLVLKPLDDLFDAMILEEESGRESRKRLPVHEITSFPERIEAFYTRDYNMINPGIEEYAGVQGGFLMVRPSQETFNEYIDLVLEGNYVEGKGWGGKYGYFFGGMQVQGICAYYYKEKHPGIGVELNRCRINAMVDKPHFSPDEKKRPNQCRDGRRDCEDCQKTNIGDIMSAHFTICQKPWLCEASWNGENKDLCSQLHREWFRIRRDFEETRTDNLKQLPDFDGTFKPENYFGYCTNPGQRNYLPIKV